MDRLATFYNFIEIVADPWPIWGVLRFQNLDMCIVFENTYPSMPSINFFLWDAVNYDWCIGFLSKRWYLNCINMKFFWINSLLDLFVNVFLLSKKSFFEYCCRLNLIKHRLKGIEFYLYLLDFRLKRSLLLKWIFVL